LIFLNFFFSKKNSYNKDIEFARYMRKIGKKLNIKPHWW